MGREVWGTYSVRDHLESQPWAADVLLYDRLVIPVPPQVDGAEGSVEWQRWSNNGWQPQRQAELISILGDAAYPISWDDFRQRQWADLHGSALGALSAQIGAEARRPSAANPWFATAMVLAADRLPRRVTAVTAVATYRSADQLAEAVKMHDVDPGAPMPAGQAIVVMGREFLLPDPAEFGSDDDLLRTAVELAMDDDFRRRRTAYWRWQREFLSDGAMCVAAAGATVLAAPIAPVTLAAAFLSVGQFVAGEALVPPTSAGPAGLVIAGQKGLGWHG